jgi:hypothetical protein
MQSISSCIDIRVSRPVEFEPHEFCSTSLGELVHELSHMPGSMPSHTAAHAGNVNGSPFKSILPEFINQPGVIGSAGFYDLTYTIDGPISNQGFASGDDQGEFIKAYLLEDRRRLLAPHDLPRHAGTFEGFIIGTPGVFSGGFPIDQLGYGRPKKIPGQ